MTRASMFPCCLEFVWLLEVRVGDGEVVFSAHWMEGQVW